MCKLFGHKWIRFHYALELHYALETCERCNINRINRSGLDESENVFPEKWLDKHMD